MDEMIQNAIAHATASRDTHDPAKQDHGYKGRCEHCSFTRHPCDVYALADECLAALSAAEARVKALEGERAWRKAVPEQQFEDGDRIVVAVACCYTDRGQVSASARQFWDISVLSVHCDEEAPIRFEEANGDAWGWSWLDAEWWMPLRNLSSSLPPLPAAARAEKEGKRHAH